MALPAPADGSTCLVTGASSGIGAEIARELARRGYGVTLIARREDRLRDLAGELDVRTEVVACDVSDETARARAVREIEERGLTVEVLVNNAGFGSAARFQDTPRENALSMVRTNVEAVVDFCAVYVPQMIERGRGAILNVASTAAFQPLPRQATYGASKAFVLSFSEALTADLSGTGVEVTALCPGPVPTEFNAAAGISAKFQGGPSVIFKQADDVAKQAVDAMDKGRRVVVPGLANRLGTLAGHYMPRSVAIPLLDRFYPVGK